MSRPLRPKFIADSIAVICPACNQPQGNPINGFEMWMPQDFSGVGAHPAEYPSSVQPCFNCGAPLMLFKPKMVRFA
jgi:hypothetical protein